MDEIDRSIINHLQDGFPISDHPYADVASELGIDENTLITRIQKLLEDKILSRFGPMYHAERMGGALSLCAMKIRPDEFDNVAEMVNAYPEVAHNYARDHEMNMWFVLATEEESGIGEVLAEIEDKTGYRVYNMPKLEEFFVGLKLCV